MKSLLKISGRRRLIRDQMVGILLLFGVCNLAFSQSSTVPDQVTFVVSRKSDAYSKVVAMTKAELSTGNYKFSTIRQDANHEIDDAIAEGGIIVTVGAGATAEVMSRNPKSRLITSLITDSAFSSLAKKHYGSTSAAFVAGVSVICLDQPVERSARLAKMLMPEATDAGLMLGPASYEKADEFSRQINEAGMTSTMVKFSATENPILAIEPVLKESDVFIPVPDSRLINIATAKWILQLSYRYRVPVIAYSKAYLNGGALAAIYSSPENVGRQTADLIDREKRFPNVGGRHIPAYFSIEFNSSVAAYLDVNLKPKQFYLDRLKAD
jgi:ABC-type uncharacterized transport system substrate-binding protein